MTKETLLENTDLFLLDMDGTLYLGDTAIEGAPQAVRFLRSRGKTVCFLTNNSSKSRAAYAEKLQGLGFSPSPDEIYTSGLAAAEYLKENFAGKTAYLAGTAALRAEFAAAGIAAAGIALTENKPDVVVLGYDTETTYERLARACVYIREGAAYVATHPDINCPAPGGYLPDAGAFIKLIEASAGRLPDVICGKPYPAMARGLRRRYSVPPGRTAVIGDRLSTDIRFAGACGFTSVLVLTGETSRGMLKGAADTPHLVLEGIWELVGAEKE